MGRNVLRRRADIIIRDNVSRPTVIWLYPDKDIPKCRDVLYVSRLLLVGNFSLLFTACSFSSAVVRFLPCGTQQWKPERLWSAWFRFWVWQLCVVAQMKPAGTSLTGPPSIPDLCRAGTTSPSSASSSTGVYIPYPVSPLSGFGGAGKDSGAQKSKPSCRKTTLRTLPTRTSPKTWPLSSSTLMGGPRSLRILVPSGFKSSYNKLVWHVTLARLFPLSVQRIHTRCLSSSLTFAACVFSLTTFVVYPLMQCKEHHHFSPYFVGKKYPYKQFIRLRRGSKVTHKMQRTEFLFVGCRQTTIQKGQHKKINGRRYWECFVPGLAAHLTQFYAQSTITVMSGRITAENTRRDIQNINTESSIERYAHVYRM